MSDLRRCESCARHVFVTERACPFCRAELQPIAAPIDVTVPSSASRAQRLALAAALGTQGLLGCAETVASPQPIDGVIAGNAAPATAGAGGRPNIDPPQPVYGAPSPILPAAGRGGFPPPGVPVYGAPLAGNPAPKPDAGTPDEDGGEDAGSE